MADLWYLNHALNLAPKLEALASFRGGHIGLTGGLLYKSDPRKDADFVIYPHKNNKRFDWNTFMKALEIEGFQEVRLLGRVIKATYLDKPLDFIITEIEGDY